jgi:soluble lytic murein transglycosylase-like protein
MSAQRFQSVLLLVVSAACVSFATPPREPLVPAAGQAAASAPATYLATSEAFAPAADEPVLVEAVARHLLARGSALSAEEVDRVARAIVAESGARDLDPFLVLAVIHVESRFDAFAVSPAGAMGLMQIRPATGKAFAAKLGMAWHGARTLFDPAANVRLGIAYLAAMRRRFQSLEVALAAYNWGPTEIRRRVESGAGVPAQYYRRVLSVYAETADPPIQAS